MGLNSGSRSDSASSMIVYFSDVSTSKVITTGLAAGDQERGLILDGKILCLKLLQLLVSYYGYPAQRSALYQDSTRVIFVKRRYSSDSSRFALDFEFTTQSQ